MTGGKKRDAKFLIFQSLYIIAIAILFYKGTDLSLVSVVDANDSMNAHIGPLDTVIALKDIDTFNTYVNFNQDSVVDRSILAQITQKANENSKTPITISPKPFVVPSPVAPKTEEKKPEKKPEEKDPTPLKSPDVKEFTDYPFTNPDQEKKMFVYQDGSMLGVVEPGKTKKIRIRKGGKINYTFN